MYSKIRTKNILKLACPEFATQLMIVGATMIEMIYVAKLGVVALAAISIGNIVTLMINNFFGEIEAGARVLSARFIGAKDQVALTKSFFVSILVPAALGGFVVLLRSVICLCAFYLVGDGSLNQLGVSYLNTMLIATPFALIFFSLNGFICGIGDTLSPFFIRAIMHSFQIIFEYVLIFGLLGFPALGLQGIAIVSILTYALGVNLCLFVILHKKVIDFSVGLTVSNLFQNKFNVCTLLKFLNPLTWFDRAVASSFFHTICPKSSIFRSYLNISFDIGLQFGFSDFAMYMFVMIIGWHGVNVLAVHQIAYYQVFLSLQFPMYCFYMVSSVIIGQIVGERKILWIIPATNKILNLAMTLCLVMSGVVFIFSYQISQIFSPLDVGVAALASIAIKILCINAVIETFYIVVSGSLIGTCESRFAMETGLAVEFFVLLPLCYIFSWIFGWGIVGACLAMCVRSVINCLIVGWRFFVARKWDSAGITLRMRKTFNINPAFKEVDAYEKRNIAFSMNDFLEEGVVIPAKIFENGSGKKIS